jgi:rhodanese-related sulfurtransferase
MIKDYFKRMNYLAVLMILALSIFAISCSEETTEPTIDEAQVLLDYLEANGDFINTLAPTVKTASAIHTTLIASPNTIYVIDTRLPADFANGHVKNAVNVELKDLLTHMRSIDVTKYEQIILTCFTGQTAAYGASLLRLMGYDKVHSMKWGMAAWNKTLASKWTNSISNMRVTQLETTTNAKPAKGKLPVIKTGKKTGADILEARVNKLLAEGYSVATVTNQVVYDNLSKYFICNYWPEPEYLNPGHIPGAFQYTPKKAFKSSEDLLTLPTNKEIVLYCYTGQTSSYVAPYLRLLGYDAKSLLFGANSMINELMTANKWVESVESFDYELVK